MVNALNRFPSPRRDEAPSVVHRDVDFTRLAVDVGRANSVISEEGERYTFDERNPITERVK